MRGITRTIGGSTLTICGTFWWLFIFAGLDFARMERHGFLHELCIRSYVPLYIFVFSTMLIFFGYLSYFLWYKYYRQRKQKA